MAPAALSPRCRRWRVYLALHKYQMKSVNKVSTVNNIAFRYPSLYSVLRLPFNIHLTFIYIRSCIYRYIIYFSLNVFRACLKPHGGSYHTLVCSPPETLKSPGSPLDISPYLSVVVNHNLPEPSIALYLLTPLYTSTPLVSENPNLGWAYQPGPHSGSP